MKKVNRNRKKGGKRPGAARPFLYLLVVALLAAGVVYLLDKGRKPVIPKSGARPRIEAGEKRHVPAERPAVARPGAGVPAEIPGKGEKTAKAVIPPPVHKRYSTHRVVPPVTRVPRTPAGSGNVAIIIDDMGTSTAEVRELMAIGIPLTFSVIPGLRQSTQVAEAAHGGGYQVMVHIPMEPKDYPRRRLESNGLLLAQDGAQIEGRMAGYLRQVPYAVGANNHMGSRFTEDRERMRTVLGVLKGNGMFFVDSMTTPDSVGLSVARDLGLKSAGRNVFLDNSNDVAAIKAQLEALARLAAKRGFAVGICHPHKATIRALEEELPVLRAGGTRFVYASTLVR